MALKEFGMNSSRVEDGVWFHQDLQLRVWIYVDDILTVGPDEKQIDLFYQFLSRKFKIKDLGVPERILGIELKHLGDGGIFLHQTGYAKKIASWIGKGQSRVPISERMRMEEGDSVLNEKDQHTYREIVGSIMYLVVSTRPDLA
jgi:hypothetical protein